MGRVRYAIDREQSFPSCQCRGEGERRFRPEQENFMQRRLLPMKDAAAKIAMPVSTFSQKYEELGLLPISLGENLKSSERWVESELDEFIERRIQERDEQVRQDNQRQRDILKLVHKKQRA
jgi:predicted DNA-binding transcriptional regulator AlpA